MTPRRKKAQDIILKTITDLEAEMRRLNILDNKLSNHTRYVNLFNSFSDDDFHKYMLGMRAGEIRLFIYIPNMVGKLKLNDLFEVADSLGLSLFERICFKDPATGNVYTTPEEYLVLNVPVRRVSQTLEHKRSIPDSDRRINFLSGQVVKPDKAASMSRIEAQVLLGNGLDFTTTELMKYRGGDISAYGDFKRSLEETGHADITISGSGSVARSAVIFQNFLKGMHLDVNIVDGL